MTTATAEAELPEAKRVAGARSRVLELLAVGGATFVLWPLAWLLRASLGLDTAELAVGFVFFHAAHFLNDPHFVVSYLLFYRDVPGALRGRGVSRAQHVRWLVAGVLVPLALLGWSAHALSVRDAQSLGWMVQLMYLTVGWHYAKQGFGALVVVLGRRGVRLAALERTALLAHAYAAWAFAWASPASAAGEFEERGLVYWAPGRPAWLETVTGMVLAISTVALLVVLVRKGWRERGLPWAELACFLVTIWIWTVFTSVDPLLRYAIPALHSVQYLYFVGLVRRNEARATTDPESFGPSIASRVAWLAVSAIVLGWLVFHGAPDALDVLYVARSGGESAMGDLGPTPFFAVAYVFVNVHHFFMDFALWRHDSWTAKYLRG